MKTKKDKIIFSMHASKTQAKLLEDAIADNEWDNARAIIEQIFMEGLIQRESKGGIK